MRVFAACLFWCCGSRSVHGTARGPWGASSKDCTSPACIMMRRGGLRQRLAAATAAPPVPQPQFPRGGQLADALLNQWAWGMMSSPSVQSVAAAAVQDGLTDPEVMRLAAAGSHGEHTHNICRDVCRFVSSSMDLPTLHRVRVPVVDSRTPTTPAAVEVPILLPHQVFSYIATKRPELFRSFTLDDNLPSFWDAADARHDPQMAGHPMKGRADWRSKAVPLLLHGDAGGYTNRDSLEVTSWGGLLCSEDTWRCRYIATVFVCSAEQGGRGGTMDVIWSVLRWSFAACFEGRHPAVDHNGRAFPPGSALLDVAGAALCPGGHFGVVHALTGDMEFFAKRFELNAFYPGSASPCSLCGCNRTSVPFKDLRLDGAWAATVLHPPQGQPTAAQVFQIPGVNIFTVRLDLLHILDLGVLQHFIGSALWSFVYMQEVAGGTIQERIANLWVIIRALYASSRSASRLGRLDLTMFTNPNRPRAEYPCLKVKAAEARHLLPIVAELCRRFSTGTGRDAARVVCAEGFVRFSELCAAGGPHLSLGDANAARAALASALLSYMRLSANAAANHQLLYNIPNKFHFLAHIADQVRWLNPQLVWTYQLENLIGRAKKVAERCKPGTAPLKLPRSFMLRYRRVLQVSLR
jgi:hypothetical protein